MTCYAFTITPTNPKGGQIDGRDIPAVTTAGDFTVIIAEYILDHPTLKRTREAVPGITIHWEDATTDHDGRMYLIVWIESDDFAAVEAAIERDETVTDPEILNVLDGRRLYRFRLIGEGVDSSIRSLVTKVGGVHQHLVGTKDGWLNRTRFPDRKAFSEVYQFCVGRDIDFQFVTIYDQAAATDPFGTGLTEAQHEILIAAIDCGYLDIPRQSSLADLGHAVGISRSAASERFRRAVKQLITDTVYP